MSKDDKPIKGELVDEPTKNEPKGETVESIVVTFDGADWRVPPSFDQLDIDAIEAFSEIVASAEADDQSIGSFRHVTAFLRSLLGGQQWRRLKTGRNAADLNAFIAEVMKAYGERNRGE